MAENKENTDKTQKGGRKYHQRQRDTLNKIIYQLPWGKDSIAFFTYENGLYNVQWASSGDYLEGRPALYQGLSTKEASKIAKLFNESVLFITGEQEIDKLPSCSHIIRETSF